jgi:hypothetical protein
VGSRGQAVGQTFHAIDETLALRTKESLKQNEQCRSAEKDILPAMALLGALARVRSRADRGEELGGLRGCENEGVREEKAESGGRSSDSSSSREGKLSSRTSVAILTVCR